MKNLSLILQLKNQPNGKWVGNLGKHSTHTILAAQLIIDKKNYGLHWFIVPIRNINNHLPLSGLTVGDIGLKGGWNFEDNGFVLFNNFRIPRENLLNRYQDVSPDGKYILHVENDAKRFALTLGSLSGGRVGISRNAVESIKRALVIAVRYSAVRVQFGPKDNSEIPVIEYQLQQYRLLPYLAGTISMHFFCEWLSQKYNYLVNLQMKGEISENFLAMNEEMHAISSGAKPSVTWFGRDAIQTCRECMGGHGYSAYSRIPRIKEEHDPSLTYEGDNNVLIQQLERYLLKIMQKKQNKKEIYSPFGSSRFIEHIDSLLNEKAIFDNEKELLNGGYVPALKWRICYLLSEGTKKLSGQLTSKDTFTAFNDSQVFFLQNAAKAFMDWIIIDKFMENIENLKLEFQALKPVLMLCCDLFALWCIEKDISVYLAGGYFSGKQSYIIKEIVLQLVREFKNEAIAIVDSIAPPDEVIWSPLGQSDGEIYKNLFNTVRTAPKTFERPSYWRILRTPIQPGSLRPKF